MAQQSIDDWVVCRGGVLMVDTSKGYTSNWLLTFSWDSSFVCHKLACQHTVQRQPSARGMS